MDGRMVKVAQHLVLTTSVNDSVSQANFAGTPQRTEQLRRSALCSSS
ncbi:hypothetical protein [Lactiplantibacillus argentoratensis]|nr:hypothetical protein [Lactiplantibacillus argentoratensis]MBT1140820.1 hypothetical protein [Lactiplantibacillus argentoratensis]MBU5275921.1 hypothetical protein [Lactiplantibacillus argentoratensis]